MIRIGFLPYLSDKEPQKGVKRNCIREYIPATRPIIDSLMCKTFIEKSGSNGMIIPNPSRSINIVIKITMKADLLDLELCIGYLYMISLKEFSYLSTCNGYRAERGNKNKKGKPTNDHSCVSQWCFKVIADWWVFYFDEE